MFANIDTTNLSSGQTTAETFIPRFCSHLGLTVKVANCAEFIAKSSKDIQVLAGKSPITIAAASIYMAILLFKANVTLNEISQTLQVTEGTIKSGYKTLYEHKDFLNTFEMVKRDEISINNLPVP